MYRSQYKCNDCSHYFEKLSKNIPKKDPACPKCKKKRIKHKSTVSDKTHDLRENKPVSEMWSGAMGKSPFTKAMDATADIVMQDYGMTNLKDNLREGDNMVPPLPQELEKRVQNSWGGNTQRAAQSMVSMNAVNSGAFKDQGDVVKAATSSGVKRKINYIE